MLVALIVLPWTLNRYLFVVSHNEPMSDKSLSTLIRLDISCWLEGLLLGLKVLFIDTLVIKLRCLIDA